MKARSLAPQRRSSDPRQLAASLKLCETVDQVVRLLEESGECVNHIHVACALVTISKMRDKYVTQENRCVLDRWVLRVSRAMGARQVANTANALTKTRGVGPSPNTWRTLEAAVARVAGDMNAQGVANTANACAKCGHEASPNTWRTLEAAVARVAGDMNAQEVANTANAFTKCGHEVSPNTWRTRCCRSSGW